VNAAQPTAAAANTVPAFAADFSCCALPWLRYVGASSARSERA
jgi:hypothetical protein